MRLTRSACQIMACISGASERTHSVPISPQFSPAKRPLCFGRRENADMKPCCDDIARARILHAACSAPRGEHAANMAHCLALQVLISSIPLFSFHGVSRGIRGLPLMSWSKQYLGFSDLRNIHLFRVFSGIAFQALVPERERGEAEKN